MDTPPAATNTLADPLAQFRRLATPSAYRQPPLSLRERYVLWAAAPLILLSPWHAGSMLWWSSIANMVLALLPVIAVLLPLKAEPAGPVASLSVGQVLRNLVRFPIFWLGLLFLGYIVIQALNYSWEFKWTEGRRGFYMEELPPEQYIFWLPSGMKSPFRMSNPWQALLVWAAPWLLVCALWSSLRRRKAWVAVLWMVASLGPLIAVTGIAAEFTAPDKIFWIWPRQSAGPFGPFTYRNQASVMLYLAMACAFALAFFYQRTRSTDSGIQWFAFLLGLASLVGSVMSFSRAGWIGTGALLLVAAGLFAVRVLWQRDFNYRQFLFIQIPILAVVCVGVGISVSKVDFEPIRKKWQRLESGLADRQVEDHGVQLRLLVAGKTFEMFKDNPITGWGANSFRFYFPVYQQGSEPLTYPLNRWGKFNHKLRLFWRYAHSDWLQFLAEYGVAGSSLLLLGLFYWWGSTLWRLRDMHCEHWMLLAATGVMVGQGTLDIVFYNPVLLILFGLVLAAAKGLLKPPVGTRPVVAYRPAPERAARPVPMGAG